MKKLFKRTMKVEPNSAKSKKKREIYLKANKKRSPNQLKELQSLFDKYGIDIIKFEIQYPLPLLTNADIDLDIPTHEKKLDDVFRKEIGKVIPLLRDFTITGLEKYVKTMEKALLSLAKNPIRYAALDRIAGPCLPALLRKDRGMITSYYNLFLNRNGGAHATLLETLEGMIVLMEDDGHRARLGAKAQPPRQGDSAIGSYIQKFNDFLSRIDGIRMDSLETAANTPLRNERRRQFINGLQDTLRKNVTQPDYE
uniref:RteC protein n=1 Tax=Strongyloides papillosus TaxID=174720 RepID=A0A0N5CIE9_STREA